MENVKRVFIPGEEWLYFQVYCGNYSADYILSNDILLIVDDLFKKKLIDNWFFIRYNEPSHHLRIRFHITNLKFIQIVMQIINSYFIKLIEKHTVYDITIGIYKREIERYGADTIIGIEKLFCYDSNKAIKLIKNLTAEYDEIARIFASLLMMHDLLKNFEIPLNHCQEFIKDVCLKFKLEYSVDRSSAKKISQLYMQYKKDILLLLKEGKDPEYLEGFKEIMKISDEEIKTIKNILYKIKKKDEKNILGFVSSIIHMNINRLFRSKPGEYEMVCYNFMNQYLKSTIAQK
ncbi:MAG: thiopeptide-type bacteriocin biosynthesis protein [Flavobacterium nitrogenifigens]|uniref:thiopeptide-type bacteriocin biosynthesis protein n=1 Tax=Flavobacterium nitrogenifigens TaxID=1617283 RepID=UPI0028092370|nr:thiopeptide-type bacteriocin biosynthesis protein [Flavobacterium nitrogenifigens]MDQ8013197.1 thiopeptide-type bacteriocin biosynthesis protein [Flavobacterium nitrogenifigens]